MTTSAPDAGVTAAAPPPPAPVADTPVAIVTGANSGIGLAVCVALARAGHTVYGGMRASASADELLAAAAGVDPPGTVHVVRMDVGDDDSVATAVAAVLAATEDRVDVAVANAGYGQRVTVEGVPLRAYADMMNVNFFGALRLVKACVPSMRRRRAGRVLGVSSTIGLVAFPFFGAYAASKFAMEGFWESSHAEYKSLGVHFILIEPGPVATRMADRPHRPWSPPDELVPVWDAYAANFIGSFASLAQTPDDCAAYFVRAVSDPAPALRYMTSAPSEGLLRTKMADLDGKGVAATTLSFLAAKKPADGSSVSSAEAERADK